MRCSRLATVLAVTIGAASCATTTKPPGPPPIASAPKASAAPPIAPLPPPAAPRIDAKLPPRDVLFAFPDHLAVSMSPDGRKLAWLTPDHGVLNVWVAPIDALASAKMLTHEKHSVHELDWSFSSNDILFSRETVTNNNEETHVIDVDVTTGTAVDLTPAPGVSAHVLRLSSRFPNEALLLTNQRDRNAFDVVRLDLKTHEQKPVATNDAQLSSMIASDDFEVRIGRRELPNGGAELLVRSGSEWQPLAPILPEDALTTHALWLDKSGSTLYMLDSRNRDTAALVSIDLASKKSVVLVESARADLSAPLASPIDHKVQAVGELYQRLEWKFLDESLKDDFAYLGTVAEGEIQVIGRSDDDKRWLVQITPSNSPPRFYVYDRAAVTPPTPRHASFSFSLDKAQDSLVASFSRPHAEIITSRDNKKLVSYLTLPRGADHDRPGRPNAPLPMVLLVHNGGWARDIGSFDPYVQWLTSRGYAVLQVNFRGSAGFGKSFVAAGDHEWGAAMQGDLDDAVAWAIKEKIADAAKIAIFGGSYGGYATLVALSATPKTFACGVDISGPANLESFVGSIPPDLPFLVESATKHIGDVRTEEGRNMLASRSPIRHAEGFERPLLIAQGELDPRAPRNEIDWLVQTLAERRVPVTYAVYEDEAHGLSRPENAKSFSAIAETFLAQCLGGTYEPIGDDFGGSSVRVVWGMDQIYGLSAVLPSEHLADKVSNKVSNKLSDNNRDISFPEPSMFEGSGRDGCF